ncbi:unnamed protein product [Heterobilharzia americana]|nr:unnamed protein product [Heterobilharzia americana]
MIWQEKSSVIVMITKIMERGRNKCIRYWPTVEEGTREFPCYGGTIRVRHISERNSVNYTLRELFLTKDPNKLSENISTNTHTDVVCSPVNSNHTTGNFSSNQNSCELINCKTNEINNSTTMSRINTECNSIQVNTEDGFTVYHYHFTVWPDHGTPSDPSCVLDFMHDISARQGSIPGSGPIVVHCSAGIGRTGAFIVIDMLINYIKTMGLNCDIDISRTIQAVREQRSGMVQTETQYRFIYKAVQQYVNTMSKRIQMETDLRRTGRDYTNISRAADDIGVVGTATVPVFSSVCSTLGICSTEQQPIMSKLTSTTNVNTSPVSASSVSTSNRPCSCPIHSCSQRKQTSIPVIPQASIHSSCCSQQTVVSCATLSCTPSVVSMSSRPLESITSGFFHRLTGPGRSRAKTYHFYRLLV